MIFYILLSSLVFSQQLTEVEVGLDGLKLTGKPTTKIEKELHKISKFDSKQSYRLCAKQSKYYLSNFKEHKSWVYIKYLQCLSESNKQSRGFVEAFDKLKTIDKNANWFLTPSAEKRLTQALGAYLLSAIDHYSGRDEKKLLLYLNQIEEHRSWVNDSDYAEALFLVAKHFKKKQEKLSLEYAEKSYAVKNSKEVKDFIAEFTPVDKDEKKQLQLEDEKKQLQLEDEKQQKLLAKLKYYNRTNKWISLSKNIKKWNDLYPVSDHSYLISTYLYRAFYNSFENRSSKPKYFKKVVSYILQNEPSVLHEVLELALKYDKYDVYYELSKASYLKYPQLSSSKKLLFHYGAASTYTANYKDAVKAYKQLYDRFKTSEDFGEISFKYGLSLYRVKKYKDSHQVLAKNLDKEIPDPWRLSSMYWAWRSAEKFNKKTDIQERLMQEYPMTYYGLRARIESNEKSHLSFPQKFEEKASLTLYLNNQGSNQLDTLKALINAGWLSESSDLINDLFKPTSEAEKVVTAKVYSQAEDYFNAIKLVGDILEKKPEYFTQKVLNIAYPKPFFETIDKYSKIHNLDSDLVLSLIKQESSFNPVAESPVGAQGLMQIVRITANEIAQDLRVKGFRFPKPLQDSYTNIRFGTYYMKKLLRGNKGHIPLALACYNAGIGNIWRWVRARWELSKKLENHSSLADDEIWIDELPWMETNYYVKSILRNFLIYKILNNNIYQVNQPVWQSQEYNL